MTVKRFLLFVCAVVLIVPTMALAGEKTGVSDDEVIIGISTPLSGPAALWGSTAMGAKAWADYINNNGGIHGRKIKVIIKDDGYNPTRSMANLQEMKDKVFAVCALLGTAPCSASKDFFPANKIPLVTAYGNVRIWADLSKDKQKWYYIVYPDYEDENEYLTVYGVDKLGSKKIAHFYQNDDFGHGAALGIQKALKELGGKAELVASVPYEVTERAMGTHALKLKETGADTVIITASPTHSALIVKAMAKVGYKPKVMTNFTVADPIMYKIAGKNWEGTYITSTGQMGIPGVDPSADKVAEILLQYDPKLKGREYLAVFGAVSMMHLAKGLELAGKDLTRSSLMAGLEKIKDWKPEGMGAPVTYSPTRHHGLNAVRMSQAKDGKIQPIEDYKVFAPRF